MLSGPCTGAVSGCLEHGLGDSDSSLVSPYPGLHVLTLSLVFPFVPTQLFMQLCGKSHLGTEFCFQVGFQLNQFAVQPCRGLCWHGVGAVCELGKEQLLQKMCLRPGRLQSARGKMGNLIKAEW